jgi:hypothetical protein
MTKNALRTCGALLVVLSSQWLMASPAQAHGFAGQRFFPATLTVDDPFVSDELSFVLGQRKLPPEADQPTGGINSTSLAAEVSKRITPNLGLSLGATHLRLQPSGESAQQGFDNLALGLKYQLIRNAEHEGILSLGFDADLGGTGSHRVGAESFSTLSPGLFYGKGFGDLPEGAKYLRPLAITGILAPALPTRHSEPDRLDWGFTLQYSLQYLQSYVKDAGLKAPFNRMIAVIEFPVSTCLNQGCAGQTTGTVNPGFIWFGKYMQVGLEAAIPVNSRSGHDTGFFLQLHFFLDDLYPRGIGRPIFP